MKTKKPTDKQKIRSLSCKLTKAEKEYSKLRTKKYLAEKAQNEKWKETELIRKQIAKLACPFKLNQIVKRYDGKYFKITELEYPISTKNKQLFIIAGRQIKADFKTLIGKKDSILNASDFEALPAALP